MNDTTTNSSTARETVTLEQVRFHVQRLHNEAGRAHPSWVLAMTAEVLSMIDAALATAAPSSSVGLGERERAEKVRQALEIARSSDCTKDEALQLVEFAALFEPLLSAPAAVARVSEIPSSTPQDGWIDVNERQPREGVDVLVFVPAEDSPGDYDMSVCVVEDGCWFGRCSEDEITHWRPLPPAPGASVPLAEPEQEGTSAIEAAAREWVTGNGPIGAIIDAVQGDPAPDPLDAAIKKIEALQLDREAVYRDDSLSATIEVAFEQCRDAALAVLRELKGRA